MDTKYDYILLYRCKNCSRDVSCTIQYDTLEVSEATAREAASRNDVWCDCGWHGNTSELQFVSMGRYRWLGVGI